MEKPSSTAKPPELEYCVRLSKTLLYSRAVQDIIVSKAIAMLSDYHRLMENNIAFPELAYPIARSLKCYSKKCRVSQWSSATKALSQKLEKQIESIVRIREGISGAPKDLQNPNAK